MKRLVVALLLVAGCYQPDTKDGGFRCDATQKFLCPDGFFCDPDVGLCVKTIAHHDLGFPDMALSGDAAIVEPGATCDDHAVGGGISGLTNLGAVNTAADETALALTNDNSRIYYLSGGALMTAPLTSAKVAGTPAAVTLAGGATALTGIGFTTDGFLWVSGSDNTASQIFKYHVDSATALTLVDTHLPQGKCAITGLAFTDGDITKDLYVSYPLAGCNMPDGRGSYIAEGSLDKQMGTFTAALATPGYTNPFILAGGLTMFTSSVPPAARLYYAERPTTDALWTGPLNLPLGTAGAGTNDVQAVLSSDCKTLYITSQRTGGKGGLDFWAADVSQK